VPQQLGGREQEPQQQQQPAILELLGGGGGGPSNNDDDLDDGEGEEEEEEVDQESIPDPAQHLLKNKKKKKRKQVRFVLFDVESELVAADDDEEGNGEEEEEEEEGAVFQQNRPPPPQQCTHRPLLVCAEVLCERCMDAGVHVEREPMRRAPGCFCGGAVGPEQRARWCFPVDPQLLAGTPAQMMMPEDGMNWRRLAFHQFGNTVAAPIAQPSSSSSPQQQQQIQQQQQQQQQHSSAMAQFVDFLLYHGPKHVRTIALSHNGVSFFLFDERKLLNGNLISLLNFKGRYDMHFFLQELYRRGMVPKQLVSHGLRLYQLRMGGKHQRDVVLKDSLNFFAAALGQLPAAYGLEDVQDKPFFPYAYIRTANLHTRLEGLPPMGMYEPEGMKPLQRARFLQWYAAEQEQPKPFVLADQLLAYCGNDVRILRAAVIRYRQLIGAHAGGIEPFQAGSTIAGLALAAYRQCHLPANMVAHSPEGGFLRGRRASTQSRRFFWVLERVWSERDGHPVHIHTAEWSIGEEHVEDSGYRLDGLFYRTPPLRPLAIEFNGCFFHGEWVRGKCGDWIWIGLFV